MIAGIDISHYQGRIDWPRVRADGIDFAILKATEGTTYTDPTFARNRAGATKAGLVVGAYHFVQPGNGAGQTRHYLDVLRRTGGTEGIGLVLDQETTGQGEHPGRSDTAAIVAELRRRTSSDRAVTLYTGRWYWHGTIGDPDLTRLRVALWESRYVNRSGPWRDLIGRVQSDWYQRVRAGGLRPSLIQYSSRGRVAGISGDVDLDHYPGTLSQLRDLLIGDDMPSAEEIAHAVWAFPLENDPTGVVMSAKGRLLDVERKLNWENMTRLVELASRVDVTVLAERIVAGLPTGVPTGVTAQDVEAAVRRVLREGVDG